MDYGTACAICQRMGRRKSSFFCLFITVRNEIAKVIFLQASVCPQGEVPDQVHPPGSRPTREQTAPWVRYTLLEQTPPWTRYTPPQDQVHPPGTRYTPGPGTPPGADTSPDQVHPPGTMYTPRDQVHPPGTRYTPPGPGTLPWSRHRTSPLRPWHQVHPPRYGHCCGRYASYWNAFLFLKNNWRILVFFVGPLIFLFWNSGDIYPWFQNKDTLACMLHHLPTTDSSNSPLVWHLLSPFSSMHLLGHWFPCSGLLVISALDFKARVDPLLACFAAYVQWISCDICWPLDLWGKSHQNVVSTPPIN